MEGAPSAGIVADGVPFSVQEIFVGHKAFEADGASGVELARADADLCAEAVAEAVGEAGGAVAVNAGGVDHLHEFRGSGVVPGYDRVRVVGAVAVDVIDGFIDVGDDLERDDQVQVFRAEIVFGHDLNVINGGSCLGGTRNDILDFLCAAKLYARAGEGSGQYGKEEGSAFPVDQDGLDSIAGGSVLCLGVNDDLDGSFHVRVFVDIDVADAVGMAHDRDLCVVHDVLDKLVRSAGDEQVDVFFALQELVDLVVELGLKQAGGGKARRDDGLVDDLEQGAVGFGGLFAAFEDGTVSALDAEGGDLHHGVGSCLKNHADHADGNADALEDEPIVELPLQERAADRIRERLKQFNTLADVRQLFFIKDEALHDRGRDPGFFCRFAVFFIGGKDLIAVGVERLRDQAQGLVSLFI